jgi:hypothetical protein
MQKREISMTVGRQGKIEEMIAKTKTAFLYRRHSTMFRFGLWMAGLIGLGITIAPTAAADLSKIARTIRKEPHYKVKPKYALLVFGPEAKTRVWIVEDGETLYVDRNADGGWNLQRN